MLLSQLAALGNFVSGAAVLVTFIFLYFQLKQVKENQQAVIRQGRTSRIVEINMGVIAPAVAETIAKGTAGDENLSSTQIFQFLSYCRARFYGAEDAFYQHKEGLLNQTAFASYVGNMKNILVSPGMRVAWRSHRGSYGPEFIAFMDGIIGETQMALHVDAEALWKAEVAAEIAGTAS